MQLHKTVRLIIGIYLLSMLCGTALGAASENQSQMVQPTEITGLIPERELTDTKDIIPGLSSIYIYKFFRHIDQMPVLYPKSTTEKMGKPILALNHHFGAEDMVFDSGVSRGIGIQMNGFIKFSETGKYQMMALSNDGVRLEICKKTILSDPDVHSDRFSPQAVIDIPKPGWYPVMIQYFQRKGTAAIELHWKIPGKTQFSIIPAEAYAHAPVSEISP